MKLQPGLACTGLALVFSALLLQGCQGRREASIEIARAFQSETKPKPRGADERGFAAPGSIEPLDGIRRLAAPLTPSGLSPRIAILYVQAGDRVKAGQVLARFDNHPTVIRELAAEDTTIRALQSEIAILERQTRRFQQLEAGGVIPSADYEERELRLNQLRNRLRQATAKRSIIVEQLRLAQLVAPISGMVLSIHSRSGEQPGAAGVLDLADPDSIGAIAQVEERFVTRLRTGQIVRVISENGYFSTPLQARIHSIGHRVTPRRALETKPGISRDTEPRVVEVRLEFTDAAASSLADMTGAKVMVQFPAQ